MFYTTSYDHRMHEGINYHYFKILSKVKEKKVFSYNAKIFFNIAIEKLSLINVLSS